MQAWTGFDRHAAATARRVTGPEIPSVTTAQRPGGSPELFADPSLVREKLGRLPRHDRGSVIRSAWQYKQNRP